MNTYLLLRHLARSTKAQNLFIASKEIFGIKLFRNSYDLSAIQNFYLTWLYAYDIIMKEIVTDNISKKIFDDELYEDSYLLWRREKKYKEINKSDNKKDLKLVSGKTIKFPSKEK